MWDYLGLLMQVNGRRTLQYSADGKKEYSESSDLSPNSFKLEASAYASSQMAKPCLKNSPWTKRGTPSNDAGSQCALWPF